MYIILQTQRGAGCQTSALSHKAVCHNQQQKVTVYQDRLQYVQIVRATQLIGYRYHFHTAMLFKQNTGRTYITDVCQVGVLGREASGDLVVAELGDDTVAGVQAEHVASVSEELQDHSST